MKISIPQPCSENYNKMSPSSAGKFCSSCQKEVHDIRELSVAEIRQLVIKNKGHLCIRSTKEQLNYFNLSKQKERKLFFREWPALKFAKAFPLFFIGFFQHLPSFVKAQSTAQSAVGTKAPVDKKKSISQLKNKKIVLELRSEKDSSLLKHVPFLLYKNGSLVEELKGEKRTTDEHGKCTINLQNAASDDIFEISLTKDSYSLSWKFVDTRKSHVVIYYNVHCDGNEVIVIYDEAYERSSVTGGVSVVHDSLPEPGNRLRKIPWFSK